MPRSYLGSTSQNRFAVRQDSLVAGLKGSKVAESDPARSVSLESRQRKHTFEGVFRESRGQEHVDEDRFLLQFRRLLVDWFLNLRERARLSGGRRARDLDLESSPIGLQPSSVEQKNVIA